MGKYSQAKAESCTYCPQYKTTLGEGATECVCIPGMVMTHGTCTYCSEMAEGLACTNKGLTLQTLPTKPAFFRANTASNNTYPCLSSHWLADDEHVDCVGGNVSAQCRPHHQGML